MIKLLSNDGRILEALCKSHKKWGMSYHVNTPEPSREDFLASAAWVKNLSEDEQLYAWFYGGGYVLFDTEEELLSAYNQTLGDDNKGDPREEKCSIYALTCDPNGCLINENT